MLDAKLEYFSLIILDLFWTILNAWSLLSNLPASSNTSVSSNKIRSDYTNTFDIMLTKAIGDIFPTIDPNRSLFINLSYEKLISEANMLNYDYIADSFSLSFSKSLRLN